MDLKSSEEVALTRQAASGTSKPSIVDKALAMQSSARSRSSSAIATRAFASHVSACHVRSAVASAALRNLSASVRAAAKSRLAIDNSVIADPSSIRKSQSKISVWRSISSKAVDKYL